MKIFHILPKLGPRKGGVIHFLTPKFKKVKKSWGRGGVKKIVDFFHLLGHFLIRMLP